MRFLRLTALLLLCVFFIASCGSGPAVISDTVTPAELVQWAQEASDRNRYKQSLRYYEAILERFPTDSDYVYAAKYEIAFIHYKQKKYELSESEFNDLLAQYNTPDGELLPQQYKILANIIIARINERKK
jgi:outer membrane protein assembly factor BamD (BamD/ComL family)